MDRRTPSDDRPHAVMTVRTCSRVLLTVVAIAASVAVLRAGDQQAADPFGRVHPPRIYRTVRLPGAPPTLDDEAWRAGEWSGDYTQQLPIEGARPSALTDL